jgi:hypothetical protein
MAELSRFYGMVIQIFFMDTIKHYRPHIHVVYAEYEASVGIDGTILAGKLPVKQLRLLQTWMAIHEEELYEAWAHAMSKEPIKKIEPLEIKGL